MTNFDILIVGCGLTGSVIARELADYKYYNMNQALEICDKKITQFLFYIPERSK